MIWENGIETCIISYEKRTTSPGSTQDTGCLGLVHWDDPEGWYGEGCGAAVNTDEASLTGLLLTSCCAAWLLIDQGLVLVLVPALWTPVLNPIFGIFDKPA